MTTYVQEQEAVESGVIVVAVLGAMIQLNVSCSVSGLQTVLSAGSGHFCPGNLLANV
jgi:hypothetical protein